jgi:hypothetical protein
MITLNRMLLRTGLAVLLLTIMWIASALPLTANTELEAGDPAPFDLGEGGGKCLPRHAEVPAEVLLSARGFAIDGNNTRILELAVESVRHVDPALIRSLLSSNRSLEEIRDRIRAAQGEASCRGAIRLERRLYLLFNIRYLFSERNSTLDADIVAPGWGKALGNDIAIVGHITVTVDPSQGRRMGQGKLVMAGGQQPGSYEVLLETWTYGPHEIRGGEISRTANQEGYDLLSSPF